MKVTYNSSNSGGGWWLSDEDWLGLEKAGWRVLWVKDDPYYEEFLGGPTERFLGALAKEAEKDFETPKEAILEFEKVTGQDASAEGCNCCGPPHRFVFKDEYISGNGVLEVLYGSEATKSKRELLENA